MIQMASSTPRECVFQRILQTLAVIAMLVVQVLCIFMLPAITFYVIFCTRYWWICMVYIAWYSILDSNSNVTGERRSEWVRSWSWWTFAKDYYPVKVVKLPRVELDPKRNYMFCFFPHGLLACSSFFTMGTNATEFANYFPHHKSYMHTISLFFRIPLLRELGLSLGALEASKKALVNILSKQNGGNISGLVIGGAQEAYYCYPGVHKIIYKKRKGFIKIALTQGSPLVPVYNFGENEIFSQVNVDKNSLFQKIREAVRRSLGFSVIYPIGRKDMLGIVPRRKPITVVVGEPIDVQKTENPTQEQIDDLHQLFEKKLVELFESQKKYYLKDHETAHLEIC